MKKICLNAKFIEGSFGGGIKFAIDLKRILENAGYKVVNNLIDDDIDVIINISYFPCIYSSSSFSYIDAYLYKLKKKSNVLIISRINNIPFHNIEDSEFSNFVQSLKMSDIIVFISNYTKAEYLKIMEDHIKKKSIVIHNGGDEKIFFPNLNDENKKKYKLVTHHWSDNYKKGHKVYKLIDELLENSEFKKKFSFRYIGNYPQHVKYKNTEIIDPLNGNQLANSLRECDIYITAAENEAAGMHHIEGALCGLPLLYINSGALPEFCSDYGLEFQIDNLEEKLHQITNNYQLFKNKLKNYEFRNSTQLKKYINLFEIKPSKVKISYFYLYFMKVKYYIKYCIWGRMIFLINNINLWKNFVKR